MSTQNDEYGQSRQGKFSSNFREFFHRHKQRVNKQHDASLFGAYDGDGEDELSDGQQTVFSIPVDHAGTSIYARGWLKPESELPPVILVHDLGEHSSLYHACAKRLNEAGFNVYGYDIRGHGRSGRFLGHAPSFDCLINDLLQMVAWIRFKSKRKKPIILAQGVGGLIAVHFEAAHPGYVGKYVLLSPVLEMSQRVSRWRAFLVKSIAGAAPRLRLPRSLVPRFGPKLNKPDLAQRQLAHGISASFANQLVYAARNVRSQFQAFGAPAAIVIPSPAIGYDFSNLKEMISQHPSGSHLRLIESDGIGLQPLTTGINQLDTALECACSYLSSELPES